MCHFGWAQCLFSIKGWLIWNLEDIVFLYVVSVIQPWPLLPINTLQPLFFVQSIAETKLFASHTKSHWNATNVVDVCEKANEWKTWFQRTETHLIASWVHQVCGSDSFSRAFVLERGFSCCFLTLSYVKPAERETWHPQQPSGHKTGCLFFHPDSYSRQQALKSQKLALSGCYFHLRQVGVCQRFHVFLCFASACYQKSWKADQMGNTVFTLA